MGSCGSSDDSSSSAEDEDISPYVHIPFTIIAFCINILALQQLCGAPTDDNRKKILRYRVTSFFNCTIASIIAASLSVNLTQQLGNNTGDTGLIKFIRTLQVINIGGDFVVGYWFVCDAVKTAYKALASSKGVKAPEWIPRFWLVFICIEMTVLILCFIFAFTTESAYFLYITYELVYIAALMGSFIIFGAIFAVQSHLSNTLKSHRLQTSVNHHNNNNNLNNSGVSSTATLKKAQTSLRLILMIGFPFVLGMCYTTITTARYFLCSDYRTGTLGSSILDSYQDYFSYIIPIMVLNAVVILWTYRATTLNYFCYCWAYKKYTSARHRETDIDTKVVCYRFCGHLIEDYESKRLDILERNMNMPNNYDNGNM